MALCLKGVIHLFTLPNQFFSLLYARLFVSLCFTNTTISLSLWKRLDRNGAKRWYTYSFVNLNSCLNAHFSCVRRWAIKRKKSSMETYQVQMKTRRFFQIEFQLQLEQSIPTLVEAAFVSVFWISRVRAWVHGTD